MLLSCFAFLLYVACTTFCLLLSWCCDVCFGAKVVAADSDAEVGTDSGTDESESRPLI